MEPTVHLLRNRKNLLLHYIITLNTLILFLPLVLLFMIMIDLKRVKRLELHVIVAHS